MKRTALLFTAIALALMAGGAATIRSLGERQRLGEPGVMVRPVPLIGEDGRIARTNSVPLPSSIPGYTQRPSAVTDTELNYLPGDTTYGRALYVAPDGFQAQVSIVLMGTDRASIHRPEYCLDGQGWQIRNRQETTVRLSGPPASEFAVQRFDARLMAQQEGRSFEVAGVYVFWFVADGLRTASHWDRQWWTMRDLVRTGSLHRWAYISYFAVCDPGKEDATFERLTRLMDATVPRFQIASATP